MKRSPSSVILIIARGVRLCVPHDDGGKGLHFHGVSEEVNGRQDRHYSTPFHSDDGAITGVELAIVCVQTVARLKQQAVLDSQTRN